ncbi:MAG: SPOR domain-containing protein [Sulfurimonas sp.]|nr:MAG: SPOR domain-containing protein [Sulfurimonas sp.]
MEEKTELNDIILNQGNPNNGSKKILLAVASLAIILIVIVVIMNSLQSNSIENLPKPILPKEPQTVAKKIIDEDPLFQPVEVVEERSSEEDIQQIAKKLKAESLQKENALANAVAAEEDDVIVVIEKAKPQPKIAASTTKATPKEPLKPLVRKKPEVQKKPVAQHKTAASKPKIGYQSGVAHGKHYVQVGSFAQYAPNKAFLRKITGNGYSYTYYKVVIKGTPINKVIIGPFNSKAEARKALSTIRKRIEKGAFIIKV